MAVLITNAGFSENADRQPQEWGHCRCGLFPKNEACDRVTDIPNTIFLRLAEVGQRPTKRKDFWLSFSRKGYKLVIIIGLCYLPDMAISNKAKLLVDTLVSKGCTITEASKLAGYKGVSSRVSAYRMLHKPVQLEASKDILDRAGFKAPDKHQHLIDGNFSINIDLS